ncbi:MAG TPA: hypothetical protein VGH86_16775 [Phenylobacterium sp.]
MAVASSVFVDMPAGSYDAARPLIRNGDIALFAGHGGMSRLIEHFTGSPFSHVGFIWRMDAIDRIMLLESVEDVGVRMLPLSSKVNGGLSGRPMDGQLLVARHDDFPAPGAAFDAAFGEMTKVAVDRLGCPYNVEEIGLIGANIAAALAHIDMPDVLKPSNAYICSEYADVCYRALGIEIARSRPHFVAPADFANDPKVKAIVTLKPD